ncbi:alcohol dehydrogenase, partial [archaeon]
KFGAIHGVNLKKVASVKDEINKIAAEANLLRTKEILEPGVDVDIECVEVPKTWNYCQEIIAPGGRIANVGVHGSKVDLQMQALWIKNIRITTSLVNINTSPGLLNRIVEGQLDSAKFITHEFKVCEFCKTYEVFDNVSHNCALKTIVYA